MSCRATMALEVVDPELLRAYTSGFLSEVSDQQRLAVLVQGNHLLRPAINGVEVVGGTGRGGLRNQSIKRHPGSLQRPRGVVIGEHQTTTKELAMTTTVRRIEVAMSLAHEMTTSGLSVPQLRRLDRLAYLLGTTTSDLVEAWS